MSPLDPTEGALLEAVRAAPDDDLPRLVYADWLDERGEHERAEFIRIQIALAGGRVDDADAARLEARERALLIRNARRWAGGGTVRAEFRRGFVEAVALTPPWAESFAVMAARHPIRELTLAGPVGPGAVAAAEALAACPALRTVESIGDGTRPPSDDRESPYWDGPGAVLAAVLRSPHLRSNLSLSPARAWTPAQRADLLAHPAVVRAAGLRRGVNCEDGCAYDALSDFRHLRSLELSGGLTAAGRAAADRFVLSPAWGGVRSFTLWEREFTWSDEMMEFPWEAALRSGRLSDLMVACDNVMASTSWVTTLWEAFASQPPSGHLERLSLMNVNASPEDLDRLLGQGHAGHLRHLRLPCGRSQGTEASVLMRGPACPHLRPSRSS
jgi:uncharacterized protein (TIGR02996 family)